MIRLIPDGKTDNFPAVQAYIDSLTTPGRIEFPDGDFFFSATIKVFNKSVKFIGRDYTTLIFPQGVTGIHIGLDRTNSRCRIQDVSITAMGNRFLKDRKTIAFPEAHGLLLESTTDIQNVTVTNFGGNGVFYHGSLKINDSRSSTSEIRTLLVAGCFHGVVIDGQDSNSLGFYNCDARNNLGYGFCDSSYLGCDFYNCFGHANKMGHFHVDNDNARSLFLGCYLESDSPPSRIGGYSTIIGGNVGNGWINTHYTQIIANKKGMDVLPKHLK